MTSVLYSYAAIKSSGVHWLCHVPEHWHVRRLRTVAEMRVSNVDKHTKEEEFPVRLCNYVDVYKNDRITQAIPFMSATASRDEIEKFRLNRNDVVITKDSEAWDDIGVPSLVTEPADDLISGYHLAIIRPKENTYGPYLFWALRSKHTAYQFHVEAKGVTRYGLAHHGIQSALIPHPPLSEQKAIVRFLDHADAQIQRYIAAKGAAHQVAGGAAAGTGPPGRHPGPGPQRPAQALRSGVVRKGAGALGKTAAKKCPSTN